MAAQSTSGAILDVTSGTSRASVPMTGGTGPADAATETFLRGLAGEVRRQNVRVVGIHNAAVVETLTRDKIDATNPNAPTPLRSSR